MTESVITHQRCEYLVDPLGIDERPSAPELAARAGRSAVPGRWRTGSGWQARPRTWRAASRIVGTPAGIEGDPHHTGALWGGSAGLAGWVFLAGGILGDGRIARSGRRSPTVPPVARWTMGLLDPRDWTARWIAADPVLYERSPEVQAAHAERSGHAGRVSSHL
jgi:alpha-L-rhamnosidase